MRTFDFASLAFCAGMRALYRSVELHSFGILLTFDLFDGCSIFKTPASKRGTAKDVRSYIYGEKVLRQGVACQCSASFERNGRQAGRVPPIGRGLGNAVT
jgi:hypothetical protein